MLDINYLDHCLGFAGDSLLDQCKVDMIGDSVEDFMVKPSVQIRREKDLEKKVRQLVPKTLTILEVFVSAHLGTNYAIIFRTVKSIEKPVIDLNFMT